VDSQFKRYFVLTATVSLAPQAVNRKVLADNSARSMILAVRRRPKAAQFKADPGLRPNAGRSRDEL
jgi:hypothetical protein